MKLLGAPERLRAVAVESRRVDGPPGVDVVEDAIIPLIQRCEVKTYDPADSQTFTGWKAGVYDGDRRVCEASLLDRHWTRVAVPFWAREIDLKDARWRRGQAMYGGLLFHHYGRFLLETTNRLWWCLAEGFSGPIVFQNTRPWEDVPDFAWRFFALLGIADQVVIADQAIGFHRIFVPHRSYVGQRAFHDAFRRPFQVAGDAADAAAKTTDDLGAGRAGVYVSRTRVTSRVSVGENLIERRLADAGFHIAHPQDMPLEAQIRLVRRHTNIVGIAGSALHNILFAEARVRPTYICKDYDINRNFFMIDELMKNEGTYIYSGAAAAAETPKPDREIVDDHWDEATLDVTKILALLDGVLPI